MNLKVAIISIMLLLVSLRVSAQHNVNTTSYNQKAKRALATKRFGAGLTLLSTLTFIVAGVTSNNNDSAVAMAMAGIAGTAIGIPIWIVGAHNHKKFTRKAQNLTVRIGAKPQQYGMTLSYRF